MALVHALLPRSSQRGDVEARDCRCILLMRCGLESWIGREEACVLRAVVSPNRLG